jgi:putative nucleotidyltransferase with HDIG domain
MMMPPVGAGLAHPDPIDMWPDTSEGETVLLAAELIEASDPYTASHSQDVVDLALMVAEHLALEPACRRRVELGALLHDVGKIRIAPEIINKRGPLDDHEWEIMRTHTIIGEAMLRSAGRFMAGVARVVRHTHERHDGAGYPDGLAGDEIPIESRIVSVCDAYNAMTTDRAYRRALNSGEALDELRRCAGSQFDPAMVAALARALALAPEPALA